VGERRGVENLMERDHLGDRSLDGRIVFRWIFRKYYVGGGVWTDSSWLKIWIGGGHL